MDQTTIFIDLDGTLVRQDMHVAQRIAAKEEPILLPHTLEKLQEWDRAGYKIIITTGRRECWRQKTEAELCTLGIMYDQLVMGCGTGKRVLINDLKPDRTLSTAESINLIRNHGIGSIQV